MRNATSENVPFSDVKLLVAGRFTGQWNNFKPRPISLFNLFNMLFTYVFKICLVNIIRELGPILSSPLHIFRHFVFQQSIKYHTAWIIHIYTFSLQILNPVNFNNYKALLIFLFFCILSGLIFKHYFHLLYACLRTTRTAPNLRNTLRIFMDSNSLFYVI